MHHPSQFEAMTHIRQSEFHTEAALSRATHETRANAGQRSARWLVIALSLAALALGLALLPGLL